MTIADMTLDDLRQFIRQTVIEVGGKEDIDFQESMIDDQPDERSLEEVFASIERNRWTPPAGATPSQMMREDRDSQ
jgi:hypothetical protein